MGRIKCCEVLFKKIRQNHWMNCKRLTLKIEANITEQGQRSLNQKWCKQLSENVSKRKQIKFFFFFFFFFLLLSKNVHVQLSRLNNNFQENSKTTGSYNFKQKKLVSFNRNKNTLILLLLMMMMIIARKKETKKD